MSLSRRQFLTISLCAIAGGGVLNSCARKAQPPSSSTKQLNIYSWADYIHPQTIPEFEKRFGISVVYDTFASNETLIAKFEAGAADYDVIVPSNYAVTKLIELKHLQQIEKDRLPNFKFVMERFQSPTFDPHCQYSVPYFFGTTGIAFNKTAFSSPADFPRDWDAFWDKRLAGRMTLLEDPRETIGLALKRRGYSYNCVEEQPIRLACQDLSRQKPLTMCYSSDQVIVYLSSGDSLQSLAYSGDALQARRANPDIGYVIPESGSSMWIDSMCIPATAPHVGNAHAWLNFMLEPEIAAANANFTYYATPNQAAMKLIKPELLHEKGLYPPESVLDGCDELADIGTAIFLYDRMWTELKCI